MMLEINILGLDIGQKRIGVARASSIARLPQALCVLNNDSNFKDRLVDILDQNQISTIVVGLPRNMDGQETKQSQYVRDFCANQLDELKVKIVLSDETLSSVAALERQKNKIKPKNSIDADAAVIILEDYLRNEIR